MGLIKVKVDNTNIYDGCLNYLRDYITSELPPGRTWFTSGIYNLVGTHEPINEHINPYTNPPAFYKIFFGNHYIKPISYSLMGRRSNIYKHNYLIGWDFYGMNSIGDWILLNSNSNSQFSFGEERIFPIEQNDYFQGFMIKMTQPDSSGEWGLCIGHIEVHGYIYDSFPLNYQEKTSTIFPIHYHFLFTIIGSHSL